MMKIRCAKPVKGKRKLLCKTDEATISKVFTKDGRELVERLQHLHTKAGEAPHHFKLDLIPGSRIQTLLRFHPDNPAYHLLKFLAIRAAHDLFPDHFVHCHEIRFFRDGDRRATATYSDFVSDDDGAIGRRKEAMRRFYATTDKARQLRIILDSKSEERLRNPLLGPTLDMVQSAGFHIPHPEANYHLSDGRIVFFEVSGMDMLRLINIAKMAQDDDALKTLAFAYSMVLRDLANKIEAHPDRPVSLRPHRSFKEADLSNISEIIYSLFLEEYATADLFRSGDDAIAISMVDWYIYSAGIRQHHGIGLLSFDRELGQTIDRILRDDY